MRSHSEKAQRQSQRAIEESRSKQIRRVSGAGIGLQKPLDTPGRCSAPRGAALTLVR